MAVGAGAIAMALAGIAGTACSATSPSDATDASAASEASTQDTNNTSTNDAGTGTDSGDTTDSAPPPDDSGSAGDCAKIATLHEVDAAVGPYCPYTSTPSVKDCPKNDECCVPKFPADPAPQVCQSTSQTCTFAVDGGITVQCEEDTHCPAGKICCLQVASLGQDPGCTNYYGSHMHGSFCETTCAAGEMHACQKQSECQTGTCTPFRSDGRNFGACK